MLHYAKIYANFYWKNTQNNTIVLFQEQYALTKNKIIINRNISRFYFFHILNFYAKNIPSPI